MESLKAAGPAKARRATRRASQETIDSLAALIGFDTTSRNSNLDLIDWAEDRLKSAGARIRRDFNDDRTKANLFATFGDGPGGLVLSGHSDVVPVDGQTWSSDPFRADLRDGRIYGRGACDMKAFLGVVIAQAPKFGRARLREPIHVALTYDEELGCLGVPRLIADLKTANIAPTGCIIGEPSDMRVISAHKGGRIYRCRVTGCAGHSSLAPKGVNAIEYAARLITHIQDLANHEEAQGFRDDGYEVPFATISTNLITGGNGANIIPAACEFLFDYRFPPEVAADMFISSLERYAATQLLPRMRAKHDAAAIDFECVGDIPALDAGDSGNLQRLALDLLGKAESGKVSYGTEAGFFQGAGVPTIVCGPGSIEQAHKADEYVSLDQLCVCERFIEDLVARQSR